MDSTIRQYLQRLAESQGGVNVGTPMRPIQHDTPSRPIIREIYSETSTVASTTLRDVEVGGAAGSTAENVLPGAYLVW